MLTSSSTPGSVKAEVDTECSGLFFSALIPGYGYSHTTAACSAQGSICRAQHGVRANSITNIKKVQRMIFRSKAANGVAIIYLLLVLAAFVIMVATMDSTPVSGIILVLLTLPWSALLDALEAGDGASPLTSGLLLVGGGLVNALLIYLAVGAVAALIGRTGKP
jgi:hypothetical protein